MKKKRMSLTADERAAVAFHRLALHYADKLQVRLVGSDHKAHTMTFRHWSSPDKFTVPEGFLDTVFELMET